MTFVARYRGRCRDCGEHIEPGEDATYNPDDEVVHDDCDRPEPPPERPVTVCDRCWLTKPCDCD